ncbi:MAG: type II toxin-antitoxin system VapB family antitoxin [Bacteroidota bacterium]
MRTNIVIDQQLMDNTLKLSGLKTKRAVIEAALKTFIRLEQQRQIKKWRGKLKWDEDLGKNAIRPK